MGSDMSGRNELIRFCFEDSEGAADRIIDLLLELQAYRDIRAKSYGAALHECPLGKYRRWEDLDIPGG